MLERIVPAPLVRWFARPYLAGESAARAIEAAASLLARDGTRSTLDLLGEEVRAPARVQANAEIYRQLVDAIAADPRFADPVARPSLSLKPSAFTVGPPEEARLPIEGIAARAAAAGVRLTIDMEDRRWTDVTLALALDLHRRGWDVGAVLQTRLHRTERDLESIPAGMRVRLVIGIYKEPADCALLDKGAMKERMLDYAGRLLERGAFVEFATHDEAVLRRFLRDVAPRAPDRSEIQLLLGVPRSRFARDLRAGALGPRIPLRLYVPFAVGRGDATAYLRRRMRESPSMIWLVLRNLLPGAGR
ncbi:MAG: proline dehydrogenase family protein [Planctomycetaceae bacterium]